MAQNYVRQSTFTDGDLISASLFNNEFNQLVNSFTYSTSDTSTGHRHDGTAGQGGNIYRIGDLDFKNKFEADSTNNRWGVWVEVGGVATEQVRFQDGAIVPVTTNDVDLGSATFQFKDLHIDGTANIDTANLDVANVGSLTLTGGDAGEGVLTWNNTDNAVDITMEGGVTLQVGQETLVHVFNNSGATITNGQAAEVTGSSGSKVTVALANAASEINSSSTIGIATQDIANNAYGYITTQGLVRDIDTSAYAEGAALWLDTSNGGITTTKPVSPNHLVHLGWCVRSHATVGVIYVTVNNGWELEELHDVLITSVVDKQFLVWDNAASVWKNTADLTFANISDGVITIQGFVDEDNMASNSAVLVPTQQSVKAYVDSQVTAQDLDVSADTGTVAIDLDSEVFNIAGGVGITTTASGNQVSVDIDSTVATLTGVQTLTNKTINADVNTISNLEVDNLKAGVLDTDLTTVSGLDDTLASSKAIKAYVDSVAAAQNEASELGYSNTTSGLTATTVQAAIDEVEGRVDTAESNISTNAANIATNASNISTNASNISTNAADIVTARNEAVAFAIALG